MRFSTISSLLANVWQKPDTLLAEAGVEGEWLTAQIRIVVVALLLITPLYRYNDSPWVTEYLTGLVVTVAGWALAVAIYYVLRNGGYVRWIGFASAALDVSLVSLALFTFVIVGPPHAGVNSHVTFPIYFLAIAATSLRYDRRICVFAGFLAVIEYIAVISYEGQRWGFNNPRYRPFAYGTVSMSDQFNRVVLLIAATILAYEVVRRAEGLRRAVVKDLLTDLPNRSYMESRSLAEFSRARRYHEPLSVVVIDIDRFKKFNDRYGHATGDRVLRIVADVLRDNLRVSDVIARYGGEEFLVLLPQTDLPHAIEKVEDLLRKVAAMSLPVPDRAQPVPLTISAGIANFPVDAQELSELLLEADRRLLRAKQAGRNCVVAHSM